MVIGSVSVRRARPTQPIYMAFSVWDFCSNLSTHSDSNCSRTKMSQIKVILLDDLLTFVVESCST